MTPLKITDLTKRYEKLVAVDHVTFSIAPGEIFGLLGPNGAGKTTIISSIVTLQSPSSGTIEVFGNDVRKNPRAAKFAMGFVPQELIHHGFFTVEEILKFHATNFGAKVSKDYRDYLLERLHLYHHRHKLVSQLSGGMKRRLLIVKALLHHPKLLLLDEPTAGVDIELRHTLWDFIRELKQEKISVLLTTHYLEEAEALCDRIGILNHGRLLSIDTTPTLLKNHSRKEVTLTLLSPVSISSPYLTRHEEHRLTFHVPNDMPLKMLLNETGLSFENIDDIHTKQGTLEEVMMTVLNGRK
ncbi:MAG: ABC transporter ATP-binding protein [Chlamydiia bacterium]|nr:ABC transporter ATP-binding protein [Chlamydiia bacterium]